MNNTNLHMKNFSKVFLENDSGVETVLKKRSCIDTGEEYLIKWKNLPNYFNTWETSSKLTQYLSKKYEQTKPLKPKKTSNGLTTTNQTSAIDKTYYDKVAGDLIYGDVPTKIVKTDVINYSCDNKENFNANCLVEWKQREDGTCPANSILSNTALKYKYPLLLISYYEEKLKFKKKKIDIEVNSKDEWKAIQNMYLKKNVIANDYNMHENQISSSGFEKARMFLSSKAKQRADMDMIVGNCKVVDKKDELNLVRQEYVGNCHDRMDLIGTVTKLDTCLEVYQTPQKKEVLMDTEELPRQIDGKNYKGCFEYKQKLVDKQNRPSEISHGYYNDDRTIEEKLPEITGRNMLDEREFRKGTIIFHMKKDDQIFNMKLEDINKNEELVSIDNGIEPVLDEHCNNQVSKNDNNINTNNKDDKPTEIYEHTFEKDDHSLSFSKKSNFNNNIQDIVIDNEILDQNIVNSDEFDLIKHQKASHSRIGVFGDIKDSHIKIITKQHDSLKSQIDNINPAIDEIIVINDTQNMINQEDCDSAHNKTETEDKDKICNELEDRVNRVLFLSNKTSNAEDPKAKSQEQNALIEYKNEDEDKVSKTDCLGVNHQTYQKQQQQSNNKVPNNDSIWKTKQDDSLNKCTNTTNIFVKKEVSANEDIIPIDNEVLQISHASPMKKPGQDQQQPITATSADNNSDDKQLELEEINDSKLLEIVSHAMASSQKKTISASSFFEHDSCNTKTDLFKRLMSDQKNVVSLLISTKSKNETTDEISKENTIVGIKTISGATNTTVGHIFDEYDIDLNSAGKKDITLELEKGDICIGQDLESFLAESNEITYINDFTGGEASVNGMNELLLKKFSDNKIGPMAKVRAGSLVGGSYYKEKIQKLANKKVEQDSAENFSEIFSDLEELIR